jgi:hypothetical protein
MDVGLNYRFDYETDSTSRFASHMADFVSHGITKLSLVLYWGTFESTSGTYTTSEYTKLKHILAAAQTAGLGVHIDFHTLFPTSSSGWATPTNLAGNTLSILSGAARTQYLNWITHTVDEIKSYTCIESYSVLNEPARTSTTSAQILQYESLWADARTAVRALHVKPVGVRFSLADISKFHTVNMAGLDVFFINEYLDYADESHDAWGATWTTLRNWRDWAISESMTVYICEFNGYKTTPDVTYAGIVGHLLKLYNLTGITQAYFWGWKGSSTWTYDLCASDNVTPNVDMDAFVDYIPASITYNIETSHTTGGSINPDSGVVNYDDAEEITLTATADPTYTFLYWVKNGVTFIETNPYTFNASEDAVFHAVFSLTPTVSTFTVTVSTDTGGEMNVLAGTYTTPTGDTTTYTVTAQNGYSFVEWQLDGVAYGTSNSVSLSTLASGNYTLHAVITEDAPPDAPQVAPIPDADYGGSDKLTEAIRIIEMQNNPDHLNRAITIIEKQKTNTIWTAGLWVGGLWEKSTLREAIRRIEQT